MRCTLVEKPGEHHGPMTHDLTIAEFDAYRPALTVNTGYSTICGHCVE